MSKIDFHSYGLKPLFTFEHFVVGANNEFAAKACQAVAKAPGETYNPLFLYGPPGVGKTHLVQSVAHYILQEHPKAKIKYVSAERFMSDIIAAISDDNVMPVRDHYSELDLLILDDIQFLTESKSAQEEFLHIVNMINQNSHQVILAADRPPNQLAALNTTLRSRLEGGLATDIKTPDTAMRIEILKKKQASQGLKLGDDVLRYVAERLISNVRELEGFLKRIHAYATLSHQELTMDLVKSVVREILPNGVEPAITSAPHSTPAPAYTSTAPAMPPAPVAPIPAVITTPPVSAPLPKTAPPVPQEAPPALIPVANGDATLVVKNGNGNGNGHKAPSESIPMLEREDIWANGKSKAVEPGNGSPPPELMSNNSSFVEAGLANTTKRALKDSLTPPEAPMPPAPIAPRNGASPKASTPPPPPPPPVQVKPAPPKEIIPDLPVEEPEEEATAGHKEVSAVFFYPAGCKEALESVHAKFQEVIKKHKLKFRLKRVNSQSYECKGKVSYATFVDACKENKVPVAIVIGPPPESYLPEQDFYDLLSVTLDVQGISLQLVNWGEINKDYRYLNLALDIALVRTR